MGRMAPVPARSVAGLGVDVLDVSIGISLERIFAQTVEQEHRRESVQNIVKKDLEYESGSVNAGPERPFSADRQECAARATLYGYHCSGTDRSASPSCITEGRMYERCPAAIVRPQEPDLRFLNLIIASHFILRNSWTLVQHAFCKFGLNDFAICGWPE